MITITSDRSKGSDPWQFCFEYYSNELLSYVSIFIFLTNSAPRGKHQILASTSTFLLQVQVVAHPPTKSKHNPLMFNSSFHKLEISGASSSGA